MGLVEDLYCCVGILQTSITPTDKQRSRSVNSESDLEIKTRIVAKLQAANEIHA
jgi:hypothetical protein